MIAFCQTQKYSVWRFSALKMAFSSAASISNWVLLAKNSSNSSIPFQSSSVSLPKTIILSRRRNLLSVKASAPVEAPPTSGGIAPAISLSDGALKHLNRMKAERNEDLYLRIGVKQGGCSGMSYTMDFEKKENSRPDDSIIEYNGFTIVCDPKSLLFIFGMQLDYSDALIGGGFSFKNPNATQSCGCGKSFAA